MSTNANSYGFVAGETYLGAGFGANVNVVRFTDAVRKTSNADLPVLINYDYIIDENFGVFASAVTHFGAGSIGFGFTGGGKYRFIFKDQPFVPYVSFAISPSFLFPMEERPNHFNLGFTPGAGINYFVLAKFVVGAHIRFNPSIAFVDGAKKFELAVMTYFDVSFRL